MQEVISGGPSSPQLAPSRAQFIRSAYMHLGGAIVAFTVLSAALHALGLGQAMLKVVMGGRFVWLAVMGAFMIVGWLASHLADTAASEQTQRVGLGVYVLAEALVFAPMFALANLVAPGAIGAAAFLTLVLVAALTWTAFTSSTNFSFLGGFLKMGGFLALGAIVAGAIFGFSLGLWFSVLMVGFAGACVLFDTSRIIHEYPTNRPAGAALHLFASIALMLWYVLRILIALASDD